VYIHTKKNVLIEVNPQTRIPRTFKRFAGLMGIKKNMNIQSLTHSQLHIHLIRDTHSTFTLFVCCDFVLIFLTSLCCSSTSLRV
jgi:hypothetical protein